MKIYREGNKVIIEAEQKDCNAQEKSVDMVADAIYSGARIVFEHMDKNPGEILPPNAEEQLDAAIKDYKERWEITPAPVDPPAGGEDAR